MSSASSSSVRCGDNGQSLQVSGKVFDTLLYFVERAGQLLDRRTLKEALWPNVVAERANLTQTIHTLRRVLGERPGEHQLIVTAGRGYRFVADVRATTVDGYGSRSGRVLVSIARRGAPHLPRISPRLRSQCCPAWTWSEERNQGYFADGRCEECEHLPAAQQRVMNCRYRCRCQRFRVVACRA